MKAEQFIKDCTRGCSNELCAVEDRYGKKVISYHEWLTPEQALAAVEIAKEELIDTIEVKDVDLEKEISNYLDNHNLNIQDGGRIVFNNGDTPNLLCDFRDIAKHFFELGLKAKGE